MLTLADTFDTAHLAIVLALGQGHIDMLKHYISVYLIK